MPGKSLRDVALGQLAGCEMGLTLESEEGEVPHLRWSQAPPLPWPRPGSADYLFPAYMRGSFFAGNPPRSVRRPPPAVFSVSLSTCLYHKKKVSTLLSKSLSLSHSSVLLLWKPKKCHYYEREFACWKPAAFQFKKPLPVSIFVPNVFDFVERPLDLRASHPAEI